MKISELQEILEHYKKENGNLEVRLISKVPFNEYRKILEYDDIKIQPVYDKEEFYNLVDNIGLTKQQAFDNLKERKLAVIYLDIYTPIK